MPSHLSRRHPREDCLSGSHPGEHGRRCSRCGQDIDRGDDGELALDATPENAEVPGA
jgi:hypothetical protein